MKLLPLGGYVSCAWSIFVHVFSILVSFFFVYHVSLTYVVVISVHEPLSLVSTDPSYSFIGLLSWRL